MSLELHGQHRKCQDIHHTQTSAAINKFTDFYSFRSQKEKNYPDVYLEKPYIVLFAI